MPSDGHAPRTQPSLADGITRTERGALTFRTESGTRMAVIVDSGNRLRVDVTNWCGHVAIWLTPKEAGFLKSILDDAVAFGTYDPVTKELREVRR